jgi:hypothetical protein
MMFDVIPLATLTTSIFFYFFSFFLSPFDTAALLGSLPLRKFSAHGNPVESTAHYRMHCIAARPELMALDFSAVTRRDRDRAGAMAQQLTQLRRKRR